MAKSLTDLELIRELEPIAEAGLNQHLASTRNWNPHDYVPWSDGSNYAPLGGQEWDTEQSRLADVARVAMVTNLLTEDNLPSYHRTIAEYFTIDDAWGAWVNRWTVEENRHGIALRDYLVVTRAVDPIALEQARIAQVTAGFSPGRACAEPIADQLLKRVAADENLHMIFYRGLTGAALDIAPGQAMTSIWRIMVNFQMPGFAIPNFRRNAVKIAVGGTYDLRQHLDDVVMPVLRASGESSSGTTSAQKVRGGATSLRCTSSERRRSGEVRRIEGPLPRTRSPKSRPR
jgi:acyl-[acyl-carrier-protein] desaturase